MYKFFEHLKDCYYEIKAMSFKSRLNFDLSFWKYLFLRGLTVARSSWNCQKLKKLKVDLGKVEFVRSWKSEKLKIAWVENAKVKKFQSWKCKCWICEKLKLQKLKRQGWKCKVENAEVEPSRSRSFLTHDMVVLVVSDPAWKKSRQITTKCSSSRLEFVSIFLRYTSIKFLGLS